MKTSPLAQYILDSLLEDKRGGVRRKALTFARSALNRTGERFIMYPVGDAKINIPFSHALPIYQKQYPTYSWNVVHLAQVVLQKYPGSSIIDIGANVGDTVALLRTKIKAPILCIEGEPNYFQILQENTRQWSDIVLENVFIGMEDTDANWTVKMDQGTAHLAPVAQDAAQDRISHFETLDEVICRNPSIRDTYKMVKVDTDGFDLGILCANLGVLQKRKPILFIEYAPMFFAQMYNGLDKLKQIRDVGYVDVAVYDNFGRFLLSTNLNNAEQIEELHHYYTLPQTHYCDMAIFHQDDHDLAVQLRQENLSK